METSSLHIFCSVTTSSGTMINTSSARRCENICLAQLTGLPRPRVSMHVCICTSVYACTCVSARLCVTLCVRRQCLLERAWVSVWTVRVRWMFEGVFSVPRDLARALSFSLSHKVPAKHGTAMRLRPTRRPWLVRTRKRTWTHAARRPWCWPMPIRT